MRVGSNLSRVGLAAGGSTDLSLTLKRSLGASLGALTDVVSSEAQGRLGASERVPEVKAEHPVSVQSTDLREDAGQRARRADFLRFGGAPSPSGLSARAGAPKK